MGSAVATTFKLVAVPKMAVVFVGDVVIAGAATSDDSGVSKAATRRAARRKGPCQDDAKELSG